MGDEDTIRTWMRAIVLKHKNAMKQIMGVTFERFSAIDESEMYDELFKAVNFEFNEYKISRHTSRIKNRKSFKARLMSKLGMIVAFRRMLTHEEGRDSRSSTPIKRERSTSSEPKPPGNLAATGESKKPYTKQRSEDCLSVISSVNESNLSASNISSSESKKGKPGQMYVPKKYRDMKKSSAVEKTRSDKKKKPGFLRKFGISSSKNRNVKKERKRYRKPEEEDTKFMKYMGKMKIKFGFGVKKDKTNPSEAKNIH